MRQLRKERGITLVELSQKTGVAQATLSRIETGTMTGTIQSHELIAEAIGVSLAELYTGVDNRYEEISHLKQESERKITKQTKDVRFELLTQENSKKKITPLLLTLQPKSETQVESHPRGVEKFILILEGTLHVKVDQNEYVLRKEETLYFDASLTHQIINSSQDAAKIFIAVSPPSI